MRYNVPQYIDIEDTIVGPLTAKQILWLFGMAAVLLIVWMTVGDKVVFFVVGIPIALVFVALAFYKPQGQPLIKFIMHAVLFVVRPKMYMWKRGDVVKERVKKSEAIKTDNRNKELPKREEVENLAKILDSENEILK